MNDMHKMLNVCVCVWNLDELVLLTTIYQLSYVFGPRVCLGGSSILNMCHPQSFLGWKQHFVPSTSDIPISRRQVHILNCFLILPFMFSFATMDNLS